MNDKFDYFVLGYIVGMVTCFLVLNLTGGDMNERLKELAFEAGLTITPCGLFEAEDTNLKLFAELVLQNYVSQIMTTEEREQFIRDDERAKCAKLCDEEANQSSSDHEAGGMYWCAEAIRARGVK